MSSVSVCTLAHGRADHLANLVRGLMHSEHAVSELVVSVLQDEPYDLPQAPFPIRQIMLGTRGLCLSAARNRAAREAEGELLVFLDVDCIPHPRLIADYASAIVETGGGVLMGEVAYLPKNATRSGLDFPLFDQLGVKHSERAGPPSTLVGSCHDYRCFWSLNFAMRAADFHLTGGFDESFQGYGGEDTDFGRVCTAAGLGLWWVKGAKAYHQYHPHHMPPVHHLDSVIANAERFRSKWGEYTMQHWLRAFRLMGLAEPGDKGWRRLRETRPQDLELTRQQEDRPFASSAVVLAKLENEPTHIVS